MRTEIKQRIEQLKNGKVPDGYSHTKVGIFPDKWSVVSFDEKFNRLDRKNAEDNQNVLTISAQQGLISQQDYYNSSYASENKKGYSLLYKGDFSYNKSYSGDYLYGAIKRLDKYEKGIVSPLYICFESKEGTNSEFYLQYFESGLFNGEIYKIAQEGARNHGLLNVSVTDFFKTHLINPPLAEQQKIAEILMQCDKVIELKQKRIEEEKKLKKALMQKLLNPDSGIRLPGFKGEWKKTCIGDITELYSGGTPKSSDEENYADESGIPFIRSGEISSTCTELFLSEMGYKNSSAKMVKKGDLLYALYGANSGDCFISKMDGAINQAILCIKSKSEDIRYIYYVLSDSREKITSVYLQGGQGNLSAAIIKKLKIALPSIEEQREIVAVLNSKDTIIEKLEKELEQWQQKKKSLMQLLLTGIVRVDV